jgi:putative transport protein
MQWLQHTLQTYPEIAVFFTLAVGFYVGKLHIGKFTLGTITSVLLAGILVGQMHIPISPQVQAIFFVMFLFSVGYSAGPQFFGALKKEGLPQMLFAVAMCIVAISGVWAISLLMHYSKGQAAGLLAGSQTLSPMIGIASVTIEQMGNISAADKQRMISEIPVCYAITYIFGTAGSTWLLTALGPQLLGGIEKIKTQCRQQEEKMGGGRGGEQPDISSALATISFNAFMISEDSIAFNKTVSQLEKEFLGRRHRLFIKRIRREDTIHEATPDFRMAAGDVIVVNGRREFLLPESGLGAEVIDDELVNFPISIVSAYVINKETVGLSIKELALKDHMHGVLIQRIVRGGMKIPMYIELKIEKGDQLELLGLKKDVCAAIPHIGYQEATTQKTNMVFVGLGIVLGGIIGAFTFQLGNIPFSLSSAGVLLSGLFFGWLRSKKPIFGKIPEATVWLMDNVGLAMFVAVVGINSGPSFVSAVKETGVGIFFAGVVASTVPVLLGVLLGRYLFKLHPAFTLGCIAGSTATASLSAIQEKLHSKLPTLGYTITYAVNNILLIIGGLLMVLLIK